MKFKTPDFSNNKETYTFEQMIGDFPRIDSVYAQHLFKDGTIIEDHNGISGTDRGTWVISDDGKYVVVTMAGSDWWGKIFNNGDSIKWPGLPVYVRDGSSIQKIPYKVK